MRALTAFALLCVQAAFGQGSWNPQSVTGAEIPQGSWRDYRYTYRTPLAPREVEIARVIFLEQEIRDGKRYQWVERIVADESASTITRSLESHEEPFRPPLESFTQNTSTGEIEPSPDARPKIENAISFESVGLKLVDVEAPLVTVELIAWGEGETSHVVDPPPPQPQNNSGGFARGLVSTVRNNANQAELPAGEYRLCIAEYIKAWMISGDVDDFAQVLNQARPRQVGCGRTSS